MASSSTSTVEDWLRSLGLLCYFDAFIVNGYDELAICKEIGNEDLDAIGVNNPRDRKDILHSVYRLKASGASVVYFELEPDQPPVLPNHFISAIDQRKKFGNVELKCKLRDRIILDKVDLTKSPYTNQDGSLGKLDELVSYYADQFYTLHEDVRHALETIWKQKTLQHSKEEHSHMIPTMTALHNRSPPEFPPPNPILFSSHPGTPVIQSAFPGKPPPPMSQMSNQDIPADYLNVDSKSVDELIDSKKLKKGERLSKSLSSLENCMIHTQLTPDSSPKQSKHSFLGAVKRIFGAKKDKTGRASTESNLLACQIQMSEEDRVMLMTQVKKGEISIEEAVERFRRFEESKKVEVERSHEEEGKDVKVDENTSPEPEQSKFKKDRKSFKRSSVTKYPTDIVASEITMGEDERKELMIQVKRGEMSIEEALGMLKSYEAEHRPIEQEKSSPSPKIKHLSRQGSKRFSFLNRANKEPSSVFYDEDDDGCKSDQSHSSFDDSGSGFRSSKGKGKKKLKKSYSSKESSTSSAEDRMFSSGDGPPLYALDSSLTGFAGERNNRFRSSDKTPLTSTFLSQLKGAVNKPRTLNYDYAEHEKTTSIDFSAEKEVDQTMRELNNAAESLRATSPLDKVPKCSKHNRSPPTLPAEGQTKFSPRQEALAGQAGQHAIMLANRPLPTLPGEEDEGYNTMQKRKMMANRAAAPPPPPVRDDSSQRTLTRTASVESTDDNAPAVPPQPASIATYSEKFYNDQNKSENEHVSSEKTEPKNKISEYDYSICPPLPPRQSLPPDEPTFKRGGNQNSLGKPKRVAPPPPPAPTNANLKPSHLRASLQVEVTESGAVRRMPGNQTNKPGFSLKLGNGSQVHDYAVLEPEETPAQEQSKEQKIIAPQSVVVMDSTPVPPGRPKKEQRRSRAMSTDSDSHDKEDWVLPVHSTDSASRVRSKSDERIMKNILSVEQDKTANDSSIKITGSHESVKDSGSVSEDQEPPLPPPPPSPILEESLGSNVRYSQLSPELPLPLPEFPSVCHDAVDFQGNATQGQIASSFLENDSVPARSPKHGFTSPRSPVQQCTSPSQGFPSPIQESPPVSSPSSQESSPVNTASPERTISYENTKQKKEGKPAPPPRPTSAKPGGPKPSVKPKPPVKPKVERSPETKDAPPLPPRKPSFLKNIKRSEVPELPEKPLAYRNFNVQTGELDKKDFEEPNVAHDRTDCNRNHQIENGIVSSSPPVCRGRYPPQPAVRRSESVYEQVGKRLKAESICLALWPYTDKDGVWGIPVHLISRYSDELRRPFSEIAKAFEDTRTSQLQEMERDVVPCDLATLREEPEDFHSVSSVDDWLIKLGLPMYIDNFLTLDYNPAVIPSLTEDHLRYAGVVDPRHIKILQRSIDALR